MIIFVTLGFIIVSLFIGGFPNLGFNGASTTNFVNNWYPGFRNNNDYFSIFAIYFPSIIGTLAGINRSTNLKNPSISVPLGSFFSIIINSMICMNSFYILIKL